MRVTKVSLVDYVKGLIIFQLDGKEFCLDMREVYTVFNPSDFNISAIQNKSSIHIQSDAIKNMLVVIPHKYFNLNLNGINADSRVIVYDDDLRSGILVDKISEIISIKDKAIEETINSYKVHDEYISEIIEIDGREIAVFEIKKLLKNNLPHENAGRQDLINRVTRN